MAYATTAQLNAETAARKSADTTETAARIAADNALDARLDVLGPTVADINARLAAVEAWIGTYPPPTPVPVTGSAYGSGLSGDSRANQQVGAALNARLAYRFRATHSRRPTACASRSAAARSTRAATAARSGPASSPTRAATLGHRPRVGDLDARQPGRQLGGLDAADFSAPASLRPARCTTSSSTTPPRTPTANWIASTCSTPSAPRPRPAGCLLRRLRDALRPAHDVADPAPTLADLRPRLRRRRPRWAGLHRHALGPLRPHGRLADMARERFTVSGGDQDREPRPTSVSSASAAPARSSFASRRATARSSRACASRRRASPWGRCPTAAQARSPATRG